MFAFVVREMPLEEGAGCGYSGSLILLAIFPNLFHLERTGPLPPGKLLPWRTVSSDVSVSTGFVERFRGQLDLTSYTWKGTS